MRSILCLLALTVSGLTLGCAGGAATSTVTGNVTFEGKPLPDGDIVFFDPENKLAPDAGKIKDGVYSVAVKPGKKRVEIRASKMQKLPPDKKGAMGETELPMDYLPEKYNQKSELTADITSGGVNTFDFTLNPE